MIFASDLDRTLIHPMRTAPAGAGVRCVEVFEGREITGTTDRALALLDEVAAAAVFVPVTTRSVDQYRRLAAITSRASRWAVCANGATLLRDGEEDREWEAAVAERLAGGGALEEASAALARAFGVNDWLLRWRDCDGHFLYAILDLDRTPQGVEAAALAALRPVGWTAHLHGRKLYALPASLTKRAALERLEELLGDRHLVSAGDSEMDRGLLEAATVGFCPAGSELAAGAPLPAHVRLTEGVHVAAAEEILSATLELAAAGVP